MNMSNTPDISGFIDPHVHSAPDVVPRLFNDLEIAAQAAASGMRGILIKNHTTLTADRASIASQVIQGIRIWGGLVLNHAVGGFNPAAVATAAAYGAREIWMPTIDSANHCRFHERACKGLSIDDEGDADAIHEILALVARNDLILGTGHLSVPEILSLVRMARHAGVAKILITHPEAPFTNMPLSVQSELAAVGCRFERVWVFTMPTAGGAVRPRDLIAAIREVGFESTVLATDLGQKGNPSPVEGLRAFVRACLDSGFDEKQIRRMGSDNAAEWLI
jgi:hypothetical protein